MSTVRSLKIYQHDDSTQTQWEESHLPTLAKDEVLIAVEYSGINYKDALAAIGPTKILRKSPLTGGIDVAGTVLESTCADFAVGDAVMANGSGLSEVLDGGYTTHAKLPAQVVSAIPKPLDTRQAMLIGTAGFTSALAIRKMQANQQTPAMGTVAVTGASGGVGSFAVHFLHKLGYTVTAISRKPDAQSYLKSLGANDVISSINLITGDLAKAHWAGAIDALGGETLATLLKTTKPHGNVVSIGLAQSSQFAISVMPFIIRGVNLLGVTSANCPMDIKRSVWEDIAKAMLPNEGCLEAVLAQEVALSSLHTSEHFTRILKGSVQGRFLVNCQI